MVNKKQIATGALILTAGLAASGCGGLEQRVTENKRDIYSNKQSIRKNEGALTEHEKVIKENQLGTDRNKQRIQNVEDNSQHNLAELVGKTAGQDDPLTGSIWAEKREKIEQNLSGMTDIEQAVPLYNQAQRVKGFDSEGKVADSFKQNYMNQLDGATTGQVLDLLTKWENVVSGQVKANEDLSQIYVAGNELPGEVGEFTLTRNEDGTYTLQSGYKLGTLDVELSEKNFASYRKNFSKEAQLRQAIEESEGTLEKMANTLRYVQAGHGGEEELNDIVGQYINENADEQIHIRVARPVEEGYQVKPWLHEELKDLQEKMPANVLATVLTKGFATYQGEQSEQGEEIISNAARHGDLAIEAQKISLGQQTFQDYECILTL